MRVLFPAGLLAVLLLLAACADPAPDPVEVVRPVKLFAVTDPGAQRLREFPARLQAPEEAQLSFRLGGELRELHAREGRKVEAGDLIAELDDTDYRLRLQDREATYELTRSQLERMRTLVDRQVVSRAEFEERQAQFNSAEAALNLARQELVYTQLKAPFAGLVARTHVERYQTVQPNQPIVTLYAGESMDVVFQLPESLLANLRPDTSPTSYQPRVRIDSLPGLDVLAHYKEHASQPDPRTLTYEVTLGMPLPPGVVLLPGMSATVVVDFARLGNTGDLPLLVPVEAVFSPDEQGPEVRQVWVAEVQDETLRVTARDVTVGQLTANGIEILSGLEPGEQIVAVGSSELSEGQQVRPWERERGL